MRNYCQFLRGFAKSIKVTHFAQVINFCEMPHGKNFPHKVDKKNKESQILWGFFVVFVFDATPKHSLLSLP